MNAESLSIAAVLHDAAVEYRGERAASRLREYVKALHLAQASHDPDDWIRAGSAFRLYVAAAVSARGSESSSKGGR